MDDNGIDVLILIGGEGMLIVVSWFFEENVLVVGVLKMIDNDIDCIDVIFGYDIVLIVVIEVIDWLYSIVEFYEWVMLVEVMGRYVGWIVLNVGLVFGVYMILIFE